MFGVQGESQVEGRCCYEGNYSQEGDCEENDEGPWYIVFFYMQVVDEEDQNAGDDDGGEQLAQS